MTWQTISFNTLIELLLPSFLRKSRIIAILQSAVKPVDTLYQDTLYKMQHNSQVIYLEKMLNEYFEVSGYSPNNHELSKTVFISDAPESGKVYYYQEAENLPLYHGIVYDTTNTVNYKFIVNIPDTYVFVEAKLRAVIDFYKLAGKKYIIETYTL